MTCCYIVSLFLLLKFVPRNKIRQATLTILFKQVMTWVFGLLVVEKGLIHYPYRPFFKKTYKASFSFEYFFYPVLCVLFNLYYPVKKSLLVRILYQMTHASVITYLESLMEKYTKLITYKKWTWYWSLITLWVSNLISYCFYQWFFKGQVDSRK